MLYRHVPPVQQQSGIVDCGVFAIAFAVHAALGENVGEIEFQQEEMRSHLSKCLWKNLFQSWGKGGIGIITSPVGFWSYTVTAYARDIWQHG